MSKNNLAAVVLTTLFSISCAVAQYRPVGPPRIPLPAGPFVFDTAEQHKIRVRVLVRGLEHPWSLAFLPNGDMLVTERPGRIRLIRDGVLDPKPVLTPTVFAFRNAGLFEIALHPQFAENKLVYFTYSKPKDPSQKPGENQQLALAVARGRFDGTAITDVKDIFVGEWTTLLGGSRIAFAKDGTMFLTSGAAPSDNMAAQDPASVYGKILRLKDDGTAPRDNPFVGKAGYRPEIYSLGHRDQLGLAFQPDTGMLFNAEHGPNGGDEVNLIQPGKNYGWPVVSFGRTYEGPRVSEIPWHEGMEQPLVVWLPSIAPSGLTFYTGDKFPAWKGNLFVGGMQRGEIVGTGRLERVVFDSKLADIRRESLLEDLKQRIRDVRQGPDGYLYVLTEEPDGALLRIEPEP